MSDDIVTLKQELVRNADEFRETIAELRQRVETLTAERDEARRWFCYEMKDARAEARSRGWDCFKDGADAR